MLELCYEVALGDFDMKQEQLEELSRNITTAVTKRWGKTDPCFEESWRSVLRDAADTIGLEVTISEPEVVETKENIRLKAKLDEVSRREQIKDMELAQLRAKVKHPLSTEKSFRIKNYFKKTITFLGEKPCKKRQN